MKEIETERQYHVTALSRRRMLKALERLDDQTDLTPEQRELTRASLIGVIADLDIQMQQYEAKERAANREVYAVLKATKDDLERYLDEVLPIDAGLAAILGPEPPTDNATPEV